MIIRLVLPSRVQTLEEVDTLFCCLAKVVGLEEDSREDIRVATQEALVNAIVHGNEVDEARHVTLRLALHPDRVEIRILDEGRGFDPGSVPNPLAPDNLFKPSGRGILLMRALMDEVTFRHLSGGMEVTIVKRLPPAEGQAGSTPTSDDVPSRPQSSATW